MLRLRSVPGRGHETLEALRAVMLPVQLERRAARTDLMSDIDNPDVLLYMEEWPAAADLEADIRSHRFSRLLALMETATEPPTLEFRFVAATRSLDYVEAVRASAGGDLLEG